MDNKSYEIVKIKAAKEKINELWNEIRYSDTKLIKEAWDNSLGGFYLENFNKIDNTMKLINSKIDFLETCLEKYNSNNIGGSEDEK